MPMNEDLLQLINEYTKYTHDTKIDKNIILDELSLLIHDDIDLLIEHIDYFFNFINTERQSHWSFDKIQDNANKIINIVENKEQPEQRTDEWYKYRYNMLN